MISDRLDWLDVCQYSLLASLCCAPLISSLFSLLPLPTHLLSPSSLVLIYELRRREGRKDERGDTNLVTRVAFSFRSSFVISLLNWCHQLDAKCSSSVRVWPSKNKQLFFYYRGKSRGLGHKHNNKQQHQKQNKKFLQSYYIIRETLFSSSTVSPTHPRNDAFLLFSF
jgi:hypothetical protein